jgi:hypothetical protein
MRFVLRGVAVVVLCFFGLGLLVIVSGGGGLSFGRGTLNSRVLSLVMKERFCSSSAKPLEKPLSVQGYGRDLKNDQSFFGISEGKPNQDFQLGFQSYWIASASTNFGKECLMMKLLAREPNGPASTGVEVAVNWMSRFSDCEKDPDRNCIEPSHKYLLSQYPDPFIFARDFCKRTKGSAEYPCR